MITVCLCGSARFEKEFRVANREFMRRGVVVHTLSVYKGMDNDDKKIDGCEKTMADLVHLNKIIACEAVFVVGDGYIGVSTAREIVWADMHRKPIIEQARTHSWDNAAHCVRSGVWYPSIVATARQILEKQDAL